MNDLNGQNMHSQLCQPLSALATQHGLTASFQFSKHLQSSMFDKQ